MGNNIEIEKKYIIAMPDRDILAVQESYTKSDIVQIYLDSPLGITHRIRSRKYGEKSCFTETTKVRIDKMSAYENEREITAVEFDALTSKIADGTEPIVKSRHTFCFCDQLFEIDIYPQWKNTAILETELSSRDEIVAFPDFIKILADVTGDKAYSNASMSHAFPEEHLI